MMIARRTTEPAAEPVTLAEAKLHLRVDHSEEDAYITSLITAARLMCEQRTGKTLVSSGWTAYADYFPAELELPNPSVTAVASITYVDTNGTTQTLDPSAYRVNMVADPARIQPVTEWPATDDRMNAVVVVYTAGYANAAAVPVPLKQWCLLAIGDMYEHRAASTDKPSVEHGFVDGLLSAYRVQVL
jgi:uncharacterized phiE125 gp8 family phage protein